MARKYEEQGLHVPIPGLISELKVEKDGKTIGEAHLEADGWHVTYSSHRGEGLYERSGLLGSTSDYVTGVDRDFDTAVCKGYDKHNKGE